MSMTRRSGGEIEPEVDQPGLGKLREAVTNRLPQRLPRGVALRRDALAGLSTGIANVPDGLASGILAGVNPMYGLYAGMVGPIVGGLFSSTRLMVITTTSAASLAAGQALAVFPAEARESALFLMVIVTGILQVLFGLLRFGRLTRFVSYSVMSGLLLGISILIVLSQLPAAAGYAAKGDGTVAKFFDLLANIDAVDPPSLGLAVLALILAVTLPNTRLGSFGILAAIALPSLLSVLFSLDTVQLVSDVGEIPVGLPMPVLPSFFGLFEVLTGALAVAVIILVQGAGVSQSVPDSEGERASASRDFIAQGAANVASGLFRGIPVGGSLGSTALSVVSGAATRRAAIFSGLWVGFVVVAFPALVSGVAMPPLAALLIVAGVKTIKPVEMVSVWSAGWPSRLAIVTTFLSTLFLPIQVAVGIGVGISVLIYVSESSADVSVVELVKRTDGRIEERQPVKKLTSHQTTVLDVYGHLFFAGARTLESLLPAPQGVQNPVVILRMRGRTTMGATLIDVLSDYADNLREAGGRLYLTGLSEEAYEQVTHSGKLDLTGPVRAYEVTPIVGQSTQAAYADAQAWLVERKKDASPGSA